MKTLLTIYHRGEMNTVRQILALAESDTTKAIERNICTNKLSETQLIQLSDKMQIKMEDMLDKNSEAFDIFLKPQNYDNENLIKILKNHPEMIKTPIAEADKKVIYINTPTDVLKLNKLNKSIDAYDHTKNQSN